MLIFIFLPYFVQAEWVELPQIAPPRPNSSTTGSKTLKDFKAKPLVIKDESSYEEYFPISSSRSYEDSRSLDDFKTRPWNTRRSSPFSGGDGFDSSNYYRWRNTSFARVTGSPSIAESIDYTIVSPESTPLKDDEGLGFPKNIIISSKTPMMSAGPEILVKKGTKRRKHNQIDSKLDEESMMVTDDEKESLVEEIAQEEEEEDIKTVVSSTTEKIVLETEESDEVPNPDFETTQEEVDDYYYDDEYEDLANDVDSASESTKSAQVVTPSWKNFSFAGFLKYLKQIQDKFLLKTSRTVEEKVMLLENLRDKVASLILTRIENLFTSKRSKRSIWDEKEEEYGMEKHKDGIDFPSAEGALLSIAFLTFAVFLIKLVLQVIAAIKYKYAYLGSGPGALQVAGVIKRNKNARKLTKKEVAEIQKKLH